MSKAVKEKIIAVVYGVVHGVVLLQTVLAVIWAIKNFTTVQVFDETRTYLAMAKGMYSDGFYLIGYPLLINLCKWFSGIFKAPYTVFLYLFQFIAVNILTDKGMAAFLRGIVGRRVSSKHVSVLTALVITNPFVWQMIFAVLPDALCFGLSVYILGHMFLWMKKKEEDTTVFAVVSFVALLVLAVLQRKAFWVVATSVILLCFIGWIRTAKQYRKDKYKPLATRFVVPIAGLVVCLIVAVFVNGAIRKNTYNGDGINYSLSADAMKRFVYPDLAGAYPTFTDEFKAQISAETIQGVQNAGLKGYYTTLGSAVEKNWGGKEAVGIYRMMDIQSAKVHKTSMIKKSAKEWFSGVFSPFILAKRVYPFGDSANPLYLNLMWKNAPKLTYIYVTVGRWGLPVCVFLLIAGGIICLPGSGKVRGKMVIKHSLFFAGLIAQTALSALLLSVPEFDFRNVLLPCMLWVVWGMSLIIFEKDEALFFIGKEAKWEKQL